MNARGLAAFGCGALFGVGLLLSGMTDPRNVLAFLDVLGAFRPRLLFVMGGAIAVHAPVYLWVRRAHKPWLAARFAIPTRRDIDLQLVGGAAVFGVGWGIAGFCPGPAVVAVASGSPGAIVFVLGMLLGSFLPHIVAASRVRTTDQPPASAT